MKLKLNKIMIWLAIISIALSKVSVVKAESIFSNINNASFNSNGENDYWAYKTIKLKDGYLTINQSFDTENDIQYLWLKKTDQKGKKVWTKEYKKDSSGWIWIAAEHVDAVVSNDEEVIITSDLGIKKINVNNGEIIKENNDILGYKVLEFNNNYLEIGNSIFDYTADKKWGSNGLYIINNNLEVLNKYEITNTNEIIITATVENNKVYAIKCNKKDNKYSLLTLNNSLELENEEQLTIESENESFSDSGTIDFIKIENEFYYVCHNLFKITTDRKAKYIAGGDSYNDNNHLDYTAIKIIDNYIIMTGLEQDDNGNLSAVLTISDKNLNLLEKINFNELFGIQKNKEDMSIIKSITTTDNGFLVSGFLGNTSIISEYAINYNIETKTDGNGTVTSSKVKAYQNEEIEFTITPNEGYKIKEVRVTDEKGNTIIYTSNKFTMPSANVLIEASFTRNYIDDLSNIINPPTGELSIILIIGIMIIAFIGITRNKKKLNN